MVVDEIIAMRASEELKIGDVVGLGSGLPELVAKYLDRNKYLVFNEKDKKILNIGENYIAIAEALEVDEEAGIVAANAYELIADAKRLLVVMTHTTDEGFPKILKRCALSSSVKNKADLIITEMAVIEVKNKRLILKEIADGFTVEDILRNTEATLIISDQLKLFKSFGGEFDEKS